MKTLNCEAGTDSSAVTRHRYESRGTGRWRPKAWLPTAPGDARNASLRANTNTKPLLSTWSTFLLTFLSDLGLSLLASGPPDDTPGPPSGPRPAPPVTGKEVGT